MDSPLQIIWEEHAKAINEIWLRHVFVVCSPIYYLISVFTELLFFLWELNELESTPFKADWSPPQDPYKSPDGREELIFSGSLLKFQCLILKVFQAWECIYQFWGKAMNLKSGWVSCSIAPCYPPLVFYPRCLSTHVLQSLPITFLWYPHWHPFDTHNDSEVNFAYPKAH